MLTTCSVTFAGVGVLGVVAFEIMVFVRSIQALVESDGLCSTASWRWVWWICIHSGLFCFGLINNNRSDDSKNAQLAILPLMFLMSISFALATQLQYLDGCPEGGYAHLAMYIYMWGNYGIAAMVPLSMLVAYVLSRRSDLPR